MIVYRELRSIEKDLGFSSRTLYGLSNSLEKHYHTVYIPKSDGSKRKLSVPDLILKSVQRSIADNILTQYPVSKYAKAYKPGSSVQKNARPHIGKKKILKLDIDGFFDHILYSHVKDIVFNEEKYSDSVRILLTILCYHNDSLPQGAPTSPAVTNIIMYDFDETVGAFCDEKNIAYTRYCDDMTFSSDRPLYGAYQKVKKMLFEMGFELNESKTHFISNADRQTVTGLVVNEKTSIPNDYKRALRQEVHYALKFGAEDSVIRRHRLNFVEDSGSSRSSSYLLHLMGKVRYVLQIEPENRWFQDAQKKLSAQL